MLLHIVQLRSGWNKFHRSPSIVHSLYVPPMTLVHYKSEYHLNLNSCSVYFTPTIHPSLNPLQKSNFKIFLTSLSILTSLHFIHTWSALWFVLRSTSYVLSRAILSLILNVFAHLKNTTPMETRKGIESF